MVMKTIVVIPAYNEQDTIGATLDSLMEACPDMDIVVVDDGSTDGTAGVVAERGVPCICLPVNLGIGGAVKCGYKYAALCGCDIAVQFDADGQHSAEQIRVLLDPIVADRADMVIGSRFLGDGGYQSEFTRRLGIHLFSRITTMITGRRVTDITSGFRAIGRKLLQVFSQSYPIEFPDAEAILVAWKLGFRIVEVPVTMKARSGGKSFFSLRRKLEYPLKTAVSIIATTCRGRDYYEVK